MSVVGEPLLSVIFGVLFNKFSSTEFKLATTKQVREEIEKWEQIWNDFRYVLAVAEWRQMKDKAVKDWYADLHCLTYDVGDILDEFDTEALGRRKLMKDYQATSSGKVHKFIRAVSASLDPSVKFNHKMVSEIKDISKRLKQLEARKANLQLIGVKESVTVPNKSPSTSLVNEADVCGRDKDKKKKLDSLLDDDGGDVGVELHVVGFGGIGKITLPQRVYNDNSIKITEEEDHIKEEDDDQIKNLTSKDWQQQDDEKRARDKSSDVEGSDTIEIIEEEEDDRIKNLTSKDWQQQDDEKGSRDKRSDFESSDTIEIIQQEHEDQIKKLTSEDWQQQDGDHNILEILLGEHEKQHFLSSSGLMTQDDDQMKSLSSKDEKRHLSLPSSLMHLDNDQIDTLSSKDGQQHYNQRKTLSSEDGNKQYCSSLSLNVSSIGEEQFMELPTHLHSLRIERYASKMIPTRIMGRNSLQHLYIMDSVSLKIFPLFPSLKTLYIHNCENLNSPLPNKAMNQEAYLEHLCLGSCDSLHSFPLNYFPKLKALSLWNCKNLECLSIEKELQMNLASLDALEIKDCPKLRSFFEEEFQAPNLTSLILFNCKSLKLLPRMQSLKSLQSLHISKCPALKSLSAEGLPSSLVILCISCCDNITPQMEWKLAELHSLSHFEIEGGCEEMVSFPEEGLLPTNVNSLRISRLSSLKFLEAKGLQKLTSLKTLEIYGCNELNSLPEGGLPSSLSSLSIRDCSLLNPKLQKRRGREWFMIARIPSIHLDDDNDEVSDW